MEFTNLLKLIDAVAASGLEQFCYEEGETRIRMSGSGIGHQAPREMSPEGTSIRDAGCRTAEPAGGSQLVKSPLVGVFYEAPGEEQEPFVAVGDRVKRGQTLAIVEAMKLMNEIECEMDGVVKEVLVKNGETVEYGQPLFVIGALDG